jgi:hypothetical protein
MMSKAFDWTGFYCGVAVQATVLGKEKSALFVSRRRLVFVVEGSLRRMMQLLLLLLLLLLLRLRLLRGLEQLVVLSLPLQVVLQ